MSFRTVCTKTKIICDFRSFSTYTEKTRQRVALINTGRQLSLARDGPVLRGFIRYAGS